MRKRILVVLSAMFVFGLFATVFAMSETNASAGKTEVSCPMQKSQGNESAQTLDLSKVVVVKSDNSGEDCCQPGADCCKGGACCRKKS